MVRRDERQAWRCRWCLAGLALAATLLAAGRSGAENPLVRVEDIRIRGNVVLIDDVYRAVLKLPARARANHQTARLVRRQLLRFLHRAGYLLATVEARADQGHIAVEMDEGRLDKVIFLGAGTYKTLRMKLDISLPKHVFNRPYLVRQLHRWGRKYGISPVTYRLVRCRDVKHHGPQLSFAAGVAGTLVPPPGKYELHIRLGRSSWGTGLDVDLDYDFPDGLALGSSFRAQGLLLGGDRWLVGGKLGMKFREHLDGGDIFLTLSRARLEGKWFTPELLGWRLRPYLWLAGEVTTAQRADLEVDLYYGARLYASGNLGVEPLPGLELSLGGGVSQRYLFGIEQSAGATTTIAEQRQFRPFVVGRLEWVFNPELLRRDRCHRLELEVRHFWPSGGGNYGLGRAGYQRIFAFGWHDLVLHLHGAWLWGQYSFDDQEPVGGRYLRGVFGDRWFVGQVGGLSLEFRLSLARDLFKVSVFHDLAAFAERQPGQEGWRLRFADSLGLGFHMLVLDWLQFNIYYAVGFAFHGGFDHGVAAKLVKAF